jgi:hypothetical protein
VCPAGLRAGPILALAFVDFVQAAAQARVVDEDVDGLPLLRQCGDGALDGGVIGHVECEGVDRRCAREGRALGIEAILAASGENQAGALHGEGACGGEADAGAGAGDEGGLLCERRVCGCW